MLTNTDLASDLEALSKQAGELARQVKAGDDLPPRRLAAGLVESEKIGERLTKLQKQLAGNGNGNGKKRK